MYDIIFDVDGTLANVEHRIKFVRAKPKNWPAFDRAMVHDTPNHDIIWVLKSFHASGARILIASGRSDKDEDVTRNWLDNVADIKGLYKRLYMRPRKDNRSDDIIKSEILDQMIKDGFNPVMAVDDRNQVVDMWRRRGIRCLQVAPGDF